MMRAPRTRGAVLLLFAILVAACEASPSPSAQSAAEMVLCDGEVFDGYADTPFRLQSETDADPRIRKIIRNCMFRNATQHAIVLREARNVLIQGNSFENIRTGEPGRGVHAIYIHGARPSEGIEIVGNFFSEIGADGVQLADGGRLVHEVTLRENTFTGTEGVGENAIDVKGAAGPIRIIGNTVRGFRPCVSPSRGGTQDCSGSQGAGIVIHDGEASGSASFVSLTGNLVYDNVYGIVVSSGASEIVVQANRIQDNLDIGLLVDGAATGPITIEGNAFSNNPIQIRIQELTTDCSLLRNTLDGPQTVVLLRTTCTAG